MKRFFWLSFFLFIPFLVAGQVVNEFDTAPADTNYWQWFMPVQPGNTTSTVGGHYQTSSNADSALGWISVSYIDNPVFSGAGAMKLDYSVHNIEGWGGYTKLEHWNPDSNGVYDWSAYDSLRLWFYNETKQSLPGRVTFRLNLHDVSDADSGNKTYDVGDCEYYYSFHNILDMEPGWNKIELALVEDANWNGTAFNLTGWSGITGNAILDKDKIKGFSFEFSISGGGEGDYATGTIILDRMELFSLKSVPFVIFNGKNVSGRLTSFTWGQSSLEVVEGAGATPNTNALKWVQGNEWGNGWSGAGFNIDPPMNLAGSWATDSLKFKMKAEAGTGTMRMQFEDGTAKVGHVFDPIADDQWHDYAFKLSDFQYQDGTSNFDSSAITVFQFMGEGTAIAGKVIYFDDMWTGNPVIDVLSPSPPTGLDAIPAQYYNLVIWEDVPGESGETYDVYASETPITSLDGPGVELVAGKVQEGTQTAAHWLYFPLADNDITYYYAIVSRDASGNVSETFTTAGPFTNTAKGIPTFALEPPADFVADGIFTEWENSGIRPWVIKPETDHVPVGAVTDSTDLKATVYLAMDDKNLYIAADVIDDVFHYGEGNWWDQDALQLFVGLYDHRGPDHKSIMRGAEPDYIIYCVQDKLVRDNPENSVLYTPEDANYHFEELGGADYVIEAKIPFDSLLIADETFKPMRGMKIPLDIYFHDNDGAGWEGNVGWSKKSTDQQWNNPGEWAFTWIGDTTAVVTAVDEEDNPGVILTYELGQNYPNPFNPTTSIEYAIAKPGMVRIELFNVLGQKIKTLVDTYQVTGRYTYHLNASTLNSGIYFYHIQAGDFSLTKKMILMK